MRTILHFLVRALFGYRTENAAVLQTPGPVVLLPNHTSWVDWLFIAVCLDTSWRFVTSKEGARVSWVHRLVMINRFTFPVETDSPFAVKRIAEYLRSGGKLVIFPEGRLSRTGALMKLFEGTGFLLLKTNAKVITCHVRGAARLPFSPNPNRKQWFPRVSAHFGAALTPPRFQGISATSARHKLTRWLYDIMVRQQFEVEMAAGPANVAAAIAATARRRPEGGGVARSFAPQTELPAIAGGGGGPGRAVAAIIARWRRAAGGRAVAQFQRLSRHPPEPVGCGQSARHFQLFRRAADDAGLRPTGRCQTYYHLPPLFGAGQVEPAADAGGGTGACLFGGRAGRADAVAAMERAGANRA